MPLQSRYAVRYQPYIGPPCKPQRKPVPLLIWSSVPLSQYLTKCRLWMLAALASNAKPRANCCVANGARRNTSAGKLTSSSTPMATGIPMGTTQSLAPRQSPKLNSGLNSRRSPKQNPNPHPTQSSKQNSLRLSNCLLILMI